MKIEVDFTKQLELKIKLPKQPKLPKAPNNKYYKKIFRGIRKEGLRR